jgi:uncharacterized protein
MDDLQFAWDDGKNDLNQRKHGISFEEAQTVFLDDSAIEYADPDHSQHEDRFLLLGRSIRLRLLMVCHCYRELKGVIRIISARKATNTEREYYSRRKI